MSFSRQVLRVAIHLRTFLNVLTRNFPFPLHFVHRLFRSLLRIYSRVVSTQPQCMSTDALSNQVAGSRQGSTILPLSNDPVFPQPGASTAPSVSSPIQPPSADPPPSTQTDAAALAVDKAFRRLTTPFNVIRYDKSPTT